MFQIVFVARRSDFLPDSEPCKVMVRVTVWVGMGRPGRDNMEKE